MLPTDVLKKEHRVIEKVLNALEAFAAKLESGEEVNPDILEQSLDFIRTFADRCHHGKEEDRLFQRMMRKGFSRNSGPIAVMLQEHTQGRRFVTTMAQAIERYKRGDASSKKVIIENAREYTRLLRHHIHREDNILYPLADQRLLPEDQTMLLDEFNEFERTELGTGVHEKYHRLADNLVKEAGLTI